MKKIGIYRKISCGSASFFGYTTFETEKRGENYVHAQSIGRLLEEDRRHCHRGFGPFASGCGSVDLQRSVPSVVFFSKDGEKSQAHRGGPGPGNRIKANKNRTGIPFCFYWYGCFYACSSVVSGTAFFFHSVFATT